MFRFARLCSRGLVQPATSTTLYHYVPHPAARRFSSGGGGAAHNVDRYLHERTLLGVANPAATPGELQEYYMAAIEVAKQQVPGPLLQLKVAELSQALATLTAVAPAAANAPASPASTRVDDELHFDTGTYADNKAEPTPAESRARKAHNAARLYKEAMAAKAGGAAASSSNATKDAEVEIDKNQPAWLRQQDELIQALRLAQANLNDAAVGTPEERGDSFKKSIARINVMTRDYNLNVPMERFQRFIFTERWIENTVIEATAAKKE